MVQQKSHSKLPLKVVSPGVQSLTEKDTLGLSGVLRVKFCGRLLADNGQPKSQPGTVEVALT